MRWERESVASTLPASGCSHGGSSCIIWAFNIGQLPPAAALGYLPPLESVEHLPPPLECGATQPSSTLDRWPGGRDLDTVQDPHTGVILQYQKINRKNCQTKDKYFSIKHFLFNQGPFGGCVKGPLLGPVPQCGRAASRPRSLSTHES